MWCHLPTIFRRRHALRTAGLIALCVAITTTLFFSAPSSAAPGINQTISFSGRLMNASGGIVADGYYNIQFKIYQDGSGTAAGNPDGTLKWTESYINNGGNNGVQVKNGYFSVALGSRTSFGSSVDWNQDTLWLSMNIAGSSTSCTTFGSSPCTADGEMLSMKRMTATPYAMNAGRVGGLTSSQLIQNTTTLQTANMAIQSTAAGSVGALIQGASGQTADILQVKADGTANPLVSVGATGAATFQNSSNSTTAFRVLNSTGGVVINADTSNNRVGIGTSAPSAKLHVVASGSPGTPSINSNTVAVLQNSSSSTTNANLSIISGNAATNSGIYFGDTDDETAGGIRYNHSTDAITLRASADQLIIASNRNHYFTNFGNHSLSIQGSTGTTPGRQFTIAAGAGGTTTTGAAGGALVLQGGNAGGSGNNNGGGITLTGGTGTGTGGKGLVSISASANSAVTNSVCSGNCTITQANVDNNGTVIIEASTANITMTLPAPTLTTAGRIIYLTTSGSSQNFTLSANSGGNAVSIAMRKNSTATMIWNGTAWTPDGSNDAINLLSTQSGATILTLGQAASAPSISDNALLGSMYYDTTLGKVQCYEADGWGACGSAPDNFVKLNPEYANAVMNGTDIGTITSDLCSDALNINDSGAGTTVCGTNETYNFYRWTSGEGSTQTRSIYVNYQLPSTFKAFIAGSTFLKGRTDSANSAVTYQVYRDHPGSALASCGSAVSVSTGSQSTWQTGTASGSADPSNCSFTAGDSILIRINLSAHSNANAYTSTLGFTFSNN